MPRTTKEANDKKDKISVQKNSSSIKKNSSKSVATTKSKVIAKSTTRKASSTNKNPKATVSKKISSKKAPSKKQSKSINILEYYDLPYRYNETVVKILAQTPKTLFVYWDISDSDKKNYIEQYGNDFFEKTKPVLIVHNETMNYTFEIEINDFANCWYFNVNDEKCEYSVELGRRSKDNNNYIGVSNNYLYITSSNKIESPNGHILSEKKQNIAFFRNTKTNETFSKNIANLKFIKYFGKIHGTYDIYKKIYKEDEILNINNPTSTFK